MPYDGPFRRLGPALRTLRQRRGWTLDELGSRAKVSPSNLSDYELDKARMKVQILDRLLAALKYDVGVLASEMGQKPPETEMRDLLSEIHEAVVPPRDGS